MNAIFIFVPPSALCRCVQFWGSEDNVQMQAYIFQNEMLAKTSFVLNLKTKNENVLTKHNLKAYPYICSGKPFCVHQQILWRQGGGGGTTILGDFTVVYINLVVTQNNFPFLLGEGCIFVFSQQSDLAKPAVVSALTFCICSDFKGWFQICLCCSQIWIWTLTSAGFNLGWQTCCRYWKIKSKQEWFLYRLCGGKILEGGHI